MTVTHAARESASRERGARGVRRGAPRWGAHLLLLRFVVIIERVQHHLRLGAHIDPLQRAALALQRLHVRRDHVEVLLVTHAWLDVLLQPPAQLVGGSRWKATRTQTTTAHGDELIVRAGPSLLRPESTHLRAAAWSSFAVSCPRLSVFTPMGTAPAHARPPTVVRLRVRRSDMMVRARSERRQAQRPGRVMNPRGGHDEEAKITWGAWGAWDGGARQDGGWALVPTCPP